MAAECGHVQSFKLIFEEIEEKNPKDNNGITPLHIAAAHGYVEICKMILDSVPDKNPKAWNGKTPLHFAAKNGHEIIFNMIMPKKIEDIFSKFSSPEKQDVHRVIVEF